jgi:hypothetical protein
MFEYTYVYVADGERSHYFAWLHHNGARLNGGTGATREPARADALLRYLNRQDDLAQEVPPAPTR